MSADIEGSEFTGNVEIVGGDYFDDIADAMREAGITNPRELPDATVEAIQRKHGL